MSRTADRPETAASAVERDEKGRIERGTLNPGGRPKAVRELLDLARESVPDALAFAKKLLANETADDRVRLDAGDTGSPMTHLTVMRTDSQTTVL